MLNRSSAFFFNSSESRPSNSRGYLNAKSHLHLFIQLLLGLGHLFAGISDTNLATSSASLLGSTSLLLLGLLGLKHLLALGLSFLQSLLFLFIFFGLLLSLL